ncbi:MAG: RsmD family RNA methyltransferase [Methanomethylophilus sp.]
MNRRYLFQLLGEMGEMPADEAATVVRTETDGGCAVSPAGPGYLIAEFPEDKFGDICGRLALTHFSGRYLCSAEPGDLSPLEGAELPEGTFALRHIRYKGYMQDVDSQQEIRKAGAILSKKNDVDLKTPDFTVGMLMTDRLHFFIEDRVFDADLLRERKVSERPFFSPISLHPKYARALINLTGVKRGGTVLDPFCGTGGIVIEAADMGMKAIASDFDPEMVAGTRENLDFYKLPLHDFETIDVGEIPERFSDIDAIACDPPYGRSTKTGGENVDHIYKRALEAFPKVLAHDGKAGVVLPHVMDTDAMRLEKVYEQYVHGSLSRYYHIFAQQL